VLFDSETWQMTRAVEQELEARHTARRSRLGPVPAPPFRWTGLRAWLGGWRRPLAALDREGRMAMKWVTRERPTVDRIACPWLIRRFVDPDAVFLYVPADQVLAVAEREGATPYDVPHVELGHHGAECSFDAIIKKYA
jgi:hypothetical protein